MAMSKSDRVRALAGGVVIAVLAYAGNVAFDAYRGLGLWRSLLTPAGIALFLSISATAIAFYL